MHDGLLEAGCDEAGRGCLAGPVVAAAVILPEGFSHELIRDSKSLPESERLEAREIIINHALAYGIGLLDNHAIDKHNILRASFLAMHLAIDQLEIRPEQLLIDGNRFIPYSQVPHTCVVKGDSKYMSIAAASILAKTERDALMKELNDELPAYSWAVNKGYPTEAHRKAIALHGISKYHRRTFRLLPEAVQLDLFSDL